eukprot:295072-Chlamydomonas_euryale.AAC.4
MSQREAIPLPSHASAMHPPPPAPPPIVRQVYRNPAAVDDELVEFIYRPSCDAGALGVFVSVLTGPPGPRPWDIAPRVSAPLLAMWGDTDTFVPVDSPVGNFFRRLADERSDAQFHLLEGGY